MNMKQMLAVIFLVVAIILSLISIGISIAVENVESGSVGVTHGEIQLAVYPQKGRLLDGGYNNEKR